MANVLFESGELDYFFQQSLAYRKSEYFRKMMNFSARMVHLKPFNAMLVYNQLPGARFVFYSETWNKQYHRLLKPNAKPLVVLNFKPVGYMFDLSDTMVDPEYLANDCFSNDEMLLGMIEKQFDAEVKGKKVNLETLYRNLKINGIAVDDDMNAGSALGAKIELLSMPIFTEFEIKKNYRIGYSLPYLISVRKGASCGELVASITHELGHLYCHHLLPPINWFTKETERSKVPEKPWEVRSLPHRVREMEAESVSYLVCSRLGIKTKAMEYIAGYIGDVDMIPDEVNYSEIFNAANKVLDFFGSFSYREGLLFKYDADFRYRYNKLPKIEISVPTKTKKEENSSLEDLPF